MKNRFERNIIMKIAILMIIFSISQIQSKIASQTKEPVDYVNPYMGNISHLLVPTFPTVHLPNSMLRVIPKREDYTSDLINGLPVVSVGHRGLSAFRIDPVNKTAGNAMLMKGYSYDNENVKPYRYSVYLDDEDINIDFAPSHQSAVYNITFKEGKGNLEDGILFPKTSHT